MPRPSRFLASRPRLRSLAGFDGGVAPWGWSRRPARCSCWRVAAHPQSREHASASPSRFLAFSQCMRANGVPNFPDPSSGGGIQIQLGFGDQSRLTLVPGRAVEVQQAPAGRRASIGSCVGADQARDARDVGVHARARRQRLPRPDNFGAGEPRPRAVQHCAGSRRRLPPGAEVDRRRLARLPARRHRMWVRPGRERERDRGAVAPARDPVLGPAGTLTWSGCVRPHISWPQPVTVALAAGSAAAVATAAAGSGSPTTATTPTGTSTTSTVTQTGDAASDRAALVAYRTYLQALLQGVPAGAKQDMTLTAIVKRHCAGVLRRSVRSPARSSMRSPFQTSARRSAAISRSGSCPRRKRPSHSCP